jgi:choline dehydrogenase-like flavoprotein
MAADEVFDVIVIGAGPVGETAAVRAARGGLTAAVVERRLAGGECEHYGCIPSKIPDVPGLREARPWTNREATDVHQVPERLLVIGGGPSPAKYPRRCVRSAATIAVIAEVTLDQFWQPVPVFPTASEFWLELLPAYGL